MTWAQHVNSALRKVPIIPIYLLGALPPLWFLYLGLTGGLGVEPIKELEQRLGLLALQGMVLILAITPLLRMTRINLVRFRRAIGILVFYYVACHLAVWLLLDVQAPSRIWADIVKRPYITIGMVAFALLIPLVATSNNWSLRKLGPKRWRKLHQLTYVAGILGALHFVILVKGFPVEPLLYMAAILGLLAFRIPFGRLRMAAQRS